MTEISTHVYHEWKDQWVYDIDTLASTYGIKVPRGEFFAAQYFMEMKANMENFECWEFRKGESLVALLPLLCCTDEYGTIYRRSYMGEMASTDFWIGDLSVESEYLQLIGYEKQPYRYDVVRNLPQGYSSLLADSRIRRLDSKLHSAPDVSVVVHKGYESLIDLRVYQSWSIYCRDVLDAESWYSDDIVKWDYCGSEVAMMQCLAQTYLFYTVEIQQNGKTVGVGFYVQVGDNLIWIKSRRDPNCELPVGHWLTMSAVKFSHKQSPVVLNLGVDYTGLSNKTGFWKGTQTRPVHQLVALETR